MRRGGIFRVSVLEFDAIDPALSFLTGSWAVQSLTCARLMRYPDRSPPAGYRIVPELAERWPRVSRDGKTYTFTIRRGFRFSNGAVVTARNFEYAFRRLLNPRQESPIGFYVQNIDRITARGRRLVIELRRASADFPPRMTMPFFCPVVLGLPVDPEGVGAPLAGSGPYYVAGYVRGRRVVVQRNRYYRGNRPHRIDRFVFYLDDGPDPESIIGRIERGERDWGELPPVLPRATTVRLRRRYGLNRDRYFVRAATTVQLLRMNMARRLFRGNAALRRAVNFAIDREALLAPFGSGYGAATDQLLPPVFPGYRNADIYPLRRPNLRRARRLATGHRRSGKAVMYHSTSPRGTTLAQIVRRNLASIGLDVELRAFPPAVFVEKLETRGEPWDLAILPWQPEYVDPYTFLNVLLGQGTGFVDVGFDSPRYRRLLASAARLSGRVRYRRYGDLDVQITRDAAPMAAFAYAYERNFVQPASAASPSMPARPARPTWQPPA